MAIFFAILSRMKEDIRSIVKRDVGITEFQRRVYLALLDVPKGQCITYKVLGERISCRSAQAIGQALRRNPFAVGCKIVPSSPSPLSSASSSLSSPSPSSSSPCFIPTGGEEYYTIDYCVPCHRVISSSGKIGGFCGETEGPEIERKRAILLQEGIIL